MGKTYKDQNSWQQKSGGRKKKFPRVPSIRQRSEPFESVDRLDKSGRSLEQVVEEWRQEEREEDLNDYEQTQSGDDGEDW